MQPSLTHGPARASTPPRRGPSNGGAGGTGDGIQAGAAGSAQPLVMDSAGQPVRKNEIDTIGAVVVGVVVLAAGVVLWWGVNTVGPLLTLCAIAAALVLGFACHGAGMARGRREGVRVGVRQERERIERMVTARFAGRIDHVA